MDVAYGVLYLASDEAKFVTGAELVIRRRLHRAVIGLARMATRRLAQQATHHVRTTFVKEHSRFVRAAEDARQQSFRC
jgi:hypothetical protein